MVIISLFGCFITDFIIHFARVCYSSTDNQSKLRHLPPTPLTPYPLPPSPFPPPHRWIHASCQGLHSEEDVEKAADSSFDCTMCRAFKTTAKGKGKDRLVPTTRHCN